ncbi:MAG: hypothetical protein MJ117_04820 [Lachnospiraceae bacterium]|nr:hypothetical protein [Lachnospiraceae bacterium]
MPCYSLIIKRNTPQNDKALDYAVKAAKYDELKMSATDARYVAAERKLVEEKLSRVNTEV